MLLYKGGKRGVKTQTGLNWEVNYALGYECLSGWIKVLCKEVLISSEKQVEGILEWQSDLEWQLDLSCEKWKVFKS